MNELKRILSLALAACLLLSCAACGGPDGPADLGQGGTAEAASMWLVKTQGTVAVTDGEGADVSLLDRLGLFSGYGVATQAASYGWIDLDDTKLTKMDENSGVTVRKDGKHLELTVDRGSLFFNVTKPLGSDETLDIRSSTMVTAIRGTCGWVEVPDAEHMNVYILEGTVECSVGDVTESVTAGQTAAIDASVSSITTEDFTVADIPEFVLADVTQDEALCAAIRDASGLDVLNPGPAGDPSLLEGIGYYGDPSASTMTADQASALAAALRSKMEKVEQDYAEGRYKDPSSDGPRSFAALFDAGNGAPAMIFAGGQHLSISFEGEVQMISPYTFAIWHFPGGELTEFTDYDMAAVHDGWILVNGMWPDGSGYDGAALPLNGFIDADAPLASAHSNYYDGPVPVFQIDGADVSESDFDAWTARWDGDAQVGVSHGSDIGAQCWGMAPAEDVLAALDAWAE